MECKYEHLLYLPLNSSLPLRHQLVAVNETLLLWRYVVAMDVGKRQFTEW